MTSARIATTNGRPMGDEMPQCGRSEAALLGMMLRDNAIIGDVRREVKADQLYVFAHQLIYKAIADLTDKGVPAEPATLANRIKEMGGVDDIGGYPYIVELWEMAPAATPHTHFVSTIRDNALRRSMLRQAADMTRDARDYSRPSAEIAAGHASYLQGISEAGTPEAGPFATISSEDFEAGDYSVSWHVPGLLVRGQFGVLAGPAKACKTSVAVDLAVSIATGTRFLGHFTPGLSARVAMFSSESGHASLRDIARRVCIARDLRLADVDIQWGFRVPQFGRTADLRSFAAALKRTRRELVFLDPLYLALLAGRDDLSAANLYQIGPLLGAFAEACLDVGVTPVVLHHFKKTSQAGKAERAGLSDLSFSGVGEYVRQWMLLNRRDTYVPGSGRHALALTVGGSVGHSGEWSVDIDEGPYDLSGDIEDGQPRRAWDVAVSIGLEMPTTTTKVDRRSSAIAKQNEEFFEAVRALLSKGESPTVTAIRREHMAITGSSWSNDTVKTIAMRLRDAGEVAQSPCSVRTGKGKGEQTFMYTLIGGMEGQIGGTTKLSPHFLGGQDAPL